MDCSHLGSNAEPSWGRLKGILFRRTSTQKTEASDLGVDSVAL